MSAAATSSASATSGKRKAGDDDDAPSAAASNLSPYAAKNDRLTKLLEGVNSKIPKKSDQYTLISINDNVLNLIPGKIDRIKDEYGVDWLEDLSSDQVKAVYANLTKEEVEEYHQLMVVRESTVKLFEKNIKAIQYSDSRFNSASDDEESGGGFLMFNTYSSYLMVEVITKQLSAATREVNKATKAIKAADAAGSTATKGVAEAAFAAAFAATFASDQVDHWRNDTEEPESLVTIAAKIQKLWRDLLCFTDAELGLVDSNTDEGGRCGGTRHALLQKLVEVSTSWQNDSITDYLDKPFKGIHVKTAKNGQGMGRPNAGGGGADAATNTSATPAAKKAKTAVISPDSAATAPILAKYISAIDDKLKSRVKTNLQLKISSDAQPTKSVLVVVSGATNIKKLNQICAYLTGNDSTFQYHSQRGKCMKGSRVQLSYKGETMWLADKPSAKKATAAGAAHAEDKNCKIVQLFQGLNKDVDGGIYYDSQQAKDFATAAGSVAWVSPDGERYNVTAQCIVANKCVNSNELLPRVVTIEGREEADGYRDTRDFDMSTKTGFNMNVARTNDYMLGDRERRADWLVIDRGGPGPSQAQLDRRVAAIASRALSDEDGASVNCVGGDRKNGFLYRHVRMKESEVATAGLPANGGIK